MFTRYDISVTTMICADTHEPQ